ncbi:single-stranded DNA-binding protein [Sporosarcina sp. P19]|uniref:single-stranded DNA-binding protein n=1 Tax=Sporosarcina sp. P19 TaxID=2048258 RepID=UPI001E3EFEE0|nr:single-stranded DNA-binding protein [Sporosarcina sp. P19]
MKLSSLWIMVQVWGKPAENAATYLRTDGQAAVNDCIDNRDYENVKEDGVYVTEVVADYIQSHEPKILGQGNRLQ